MPTDYDRELVAAKMRRWEKYLRGFSLPEWDELPAFELYMDQVIALLTRYLDFLLYDTKTDTVITASSINNYVRMKVMPAPVKKRYSRCHLAYLIIICIMKQSLSISYVQRMIPADIEEEQVRRIYENFISKYKRTSVIFIEQMHRSAGYAFEEGESEDISNIVVELAVSANLYKLVTEKLINLQGRELAQVLEQDPQALAGGLPDLPDLPEGAHPVAEVQA